MRNWLEKMYGDHIGLRERLLRMILSGGLVASIAGIFITILLDMSPLLLIVLSVCAVVVSILLWQIYKYQKVELAVWVVDVLVNFVLFPVAFFTSGGIEGGATIWYVLGIIFVFLLFRGVQFVVFLISTLVCFVATYLVSYFYPEFLLPLESRADVHIDSVFAMVAVSILIGMLIKFQAWVFEKERHKVIEQQEELRRIAESKSVFFANMSHEIRTPINTIIGLNEMTLREDISEEVAENAMNIQQASKMLLALINDILDMSKIDSGKMEIVPTQYETGAMFSDLVNIIWIRAHEKNLELKVNIDPELPSMLYGDEIRLKQILLNLLSNAVKYTPEGSVTLEAKSEQVDADTVRIRISIEDTGIGIRKEEVKDLFHAFRRVDKEKTRVIEGTGLGLKIAQQLLELMGGTITVDSTYMKGSVFTVTLNQKIVNANPIGKLDFMVKKNHLSRERYHQRFEAAEARVLIVDDNEMNLMVASKLLRGTQVQVDVAKSGAEALVMTRNKAYHAIFMDHVMPEMDGEQTLKRIRKQSNGLCNDAPVVALTANAMSGAEETYRRMGFEGYLAKPINVALFEATLLKYIPPELVTFRMEEVEEEKLHYHETKKKKSVLITTECVADLPTVWKEHYGIRTQTCYINTSHGRFCDVEEIASEAVLEYLQRGNRAHSQPASVEEFEQFFADALSEAEQVIHISVSSGIAKAYENAMEAAKCFDSVHVIDSAQVSGSMGILALYAAQVAKEGKTAQEIIEEIEQMKHNISTSFIVGSVESMYRNGRISELVKKTCEYLYLSPVISVNRGELKCTSILFGNEEQIAKKYIKKQLKNKKRIDTRILIIAHAGCSKKRQEMILKEVERHVKFERVMFQKVSATIASNCGLNSFGLLYRKKS